VKTLDVTKLIAPFEKYLDDNLIVNFVAQGFFTGESFFASRQKLFSPHLLEAASESSILVV